MSQEKIPPRWIMHVDMDAFFASIEQMDHPELKGKPVVVGGRGTRSVVSAASYEARCFGIHSAMPMAEAHHRCPHATFMPVRMSRYMELSQRVISVLRNSFPCVEQTSVDEAYVDVTGSKYLFDSLEKMAVAIKEHIHLETGGLTCSIGLAPVRFLAKIASDMNKPNGLTIIHPDTLAAFLKKLPVGRIPGVGRNQMILLEKIGVYTCGDALRYPRSFWESRFGKHGVILWERAQGIDPRNVEPEPARKSESAETTFSEDTKDIAFLKHWLFRHADRVGRSLRRHQMQGRTITIKIKYANFQTITRRATLPFPTCATETIYETACTLLDAVTLQGNVRLIGIGVSGFSTGSQQLFLPVKHSPAETDIHRTRLDNTMDALKKRFGQDAIMLGRLFQQSKSPGNKS